MTLNTVIEGNELTRLLNRCYCYFVFAFIKRISLCTFTSAQCVTKPRTLPQIKALAPIKAVKLHTNPLYWASYSTNRTFFKQRSPNMANRQTFILSPKWVLTMESDHVLTGHSVVVENDIIAAVTTTDEALRQFPHAKQVELNEQLLMPGLINAHGHAAMNLFKGMADDLPLMSWLNDHIWPAEGRWISYEFVEDGSKLAIAEMLKSGTTCFSDMYFFPEASANASAELGMRAVCYGPVLDFPTPYGSGADDYIEKIIAAHDEYKHHPLITIGFGPHAPYTVSDEPIQKIRTLASQLNIPIQIHLHETEFEVHDALEQTGQRPIERLDALGFLGPDVQAVHVTQANQLDMDILAKNGVHVVHCPESNLKLASGFCPVDALQKNGINVCLGTDGSASNNDLNMFGELHIAAILAKAVAKDAAALPAIEALRMATINGAKALDMADQIGSIVEGKQADLISIDFNHIAAQPVFDPVSHLAYNTGHTVNHVWIAGTQQVKHGKLCHINEQLYIERAQQWADKIALGSSPESE